VKDLVKGTLVSVVITTPLLLLLFWFIDAAGPLWWVYAFAAVALLQLVLFYLYPVLISPIFNKFTPLPGGPLRTAIAALAERTGFRTSGIFVMDGSKRSSHANAYFTGFGRNKRIVLFDTLVNSLGVDETSAVLAHEIGHEKRNHIKKGIAFSFAILFVGFYLLGVMLHYPEFYAAFGFTRPSSHAALVIFMFASSPVMFFLSPLVSLLSRKHEYEADAFASDVVGTWKPLGTALLSLHKASLSNFTPHPLYSFFHYSHPTLAERLGALESSGR
jgi:STE24 endopeptidase